MASGLLTGTMSKERVENFPQDDWRRKNPIFHEPDLSKNLAIADKLKNVGDRYNRSAGETAIAWTLRRTEVTAAIVGARSPEQVVGIIGAMDYFLTDEDIKEIERM